MIPLEEAQQFVLGSCATLPSEEAAVLDSLGHVCAEDVSARVSVPPFDNTAMDGFALRAADTANAPCILAVVADAAAGHVSPRAVGPGEAVRIMTGAPLPEGADAIAIVEDTRPASPTTVEVLVPAAPGDHIRPAGSDLRQGDLVLERGTVLGPAHLGLLRSVGRTSVAVTRRPRVGVFSTGDELVEGSEPLSAGQIYDSNRYSLLGAVRTAGFEAVDLGLARDNEDAITEVIERGIGICDAILSSGGVSVGDFDFTKVVLDRLSEGSMRWMQVAIKPAKPFAFGVVKGVPVFGLPGNPVSSLVSFECFALPALLKMAGQVGPGRIRIKGIVDTPLSRRKDGKVHLTRVVATIGEDGRIHATSAGAQGSHQLAGMAAVNALAMVPDGEGLDAGQDVDLLILSTLR